MKHGTNKFRARHSAILSKMIKIETDEKPIEVHSAFGVLEIYTRKLLILAEYDGLNSKGIEIFDHVKLYSQTRENGFQLHIVLSLIDYGWTNHSKKYRIKGKNTA